MKIYISQAIEELGIGKTKLYEVFGKTNIKPKKEGKKSYLTNEQLSEIKAFLSDSFEHDRKERTGGELFYKERIEQLESKLEQERENNKQLTLQVGQWQGRAKTLEEQNVKLLEVQSTIDQAPELPKKSWWQVWK